jgi:hypothetical protein
MLTEYLGRSERDRTHSVMSFDRGRWKEEVMATMLGGKRAGACSRKEVSAK